jgi:hypothetical protein
MNHTSTRTSFTFAIAVEGIASGSIAERTYFSAYLILSRLFLSILVLAYSRSASAHLEILTFFSPSEPGERTHYTPSVQEEDYERKNKQLYAGFSCSL